MRREKRNKGRKERKKVNFLSVGTYYYYLLFIVLIILTMLFNEEVYSLFINKCSLRSPSPRRPKKWDGTGMKKRKRKENKKRKRRRKRKRWDLLRVVLTIEGRERWKKG